MVGKLPEPEWRDRVTQDDGLHDDTVYIRERSHRRTTGLTSNAYAYHDDPDCWGLNGHATEALFRVEAQMRRYTPCKNCVLGVDQPPVGDALADDERCQADTAAGHRCKRQTVANFDHCPKHMDWTAVAADGEDGHA